eukprot:m.22178 g.22178  ORF g.22178 m.22178 type:complete len:461 (-) comp3964_c0_seq1:246-1628(-)
MATPFNFQHFLEKMKDKSAFEIVTEIKSFIAEYSDKRLLPEEYQRIIHDFLMHIGQKVAVHDLWKGSSPEELDNAFEGLEKYLMNKMYKACFQPAASDDVSKDMVLREKLALMSFIRPEHLDIPAGWAEGDHIKMAQKELCRMDDYKAPRDKMICVLNCCKIINNILQLKAKKASGADEFFPMLVFVIISANPKNLYSNMRFIQRFRNEDKLCGEAGYYFTTLEGAIEFASKLTPDNLTISKDEFDRELDLKLQAMESVADPAIDLGGVVPPKGTVVPPMAGKLIDFGDAAIPTPPSGGTNSPAISTTSTDPFARNPSLGNLISLDMAAPPATLQQQTPASGGGGGALSKVAAFFGGSGAEGDGVAKASKGPNGSTGAPSSSPNGGTGKSATRGGKLSEDPGALKEFLSALGEPPVNKFLECSVEDLTMVDIPLLLADYKRIVKLTGKAKALLEDQGFKS